MGVIYKLTFSNGKIYVGMTTVSLRNRLYCHSFKAKADRPKLMIHRAWKLYGQPKAEIIAEIENSLLAEAEKKFIRLFDSYGPKGYNMTPGGEDGPMKRPEIVAKVRALALTSERIARNKQIHCGSKRDSDFGKRQSRLLKGKGLGVPKSLEMRNKLSATNKGKSNRWGFKNTDKTKLKMSESAKLRWSDKSEKERMRKIAFEREARKRNV